MINQRIFQQCRYFRYERTCPYVDGSDEAFFWYFESLYFNNDYKTRKYWESFAIENEPEFASLPISARGMISHTIGCFINMSPMGTDQAVERLKRYNPQITEEELFHELKKKDLIHRCRYYHGEETSDNPENALWWDYEKVWVDLHLKHDWKQIKEYTKLLVEKGYARLRPIDGTPAALKGILLSEFSKWRSADYKFAIGYEEDYLKVDERISEEWYNESHHVYLPPKNIWKEYDWLRRQDLIAQCRYYRDDEECPKDVNEFWWNTEKEWVELNNSHQYAELDENLRLYISCGMGNYRCTDKTPSTLKALFWKKQYPETDPKMLSLAFKVIYERDYLQLDESPTLSDFNEHARDIPSFAWKYRNFFKHGYCEDGYFFLACSDFYQEATELGFELVFEEATEKSLRGPTKSKEELWDALNNVSDVKALGGIILSQWRMLSRAGYSSKDLWAIRKPFWRAFDHLLELSAKDNEDFYKLSLDYISVPAKDIADFAKKYTYFFEYGSDVERYYFDDCLTFSDECSSFGFDMDGFRSLDEFYKSDPAFAKMSNEEFIGNITDIKLIGTALHSQWRWYNHWADPGSELWDSREWFLLMFERLLMLAEKQRKPKKGSKKQIALEEAMRIGYEGVKYWKKWKGLSVYSALYRVDENGEEIPMEIGLPMMVFVSDDLKAFSYQGFLTDKEITSIIEALSTE